jgi:hypothetical protein
MSRTTLRQHVRRARGRDPNALCRRCDQVRSRLVIGLVLAVAAAVVLAVLIGMTSRQSLRQDAQREAEHRHQVSATTVTRAELDSDATRAGVREHATAKAVWTFPQSQRHTGTVEVPSQTPTGGKVTIWVNDKGAAVRAPATDGDLVGTAVSYGLGGFVILSAASFACFALRARSLERRSLAEWEREWEQVEPGWSGRPLHGG